MSFSDNPRSILNRCSDPPLIVKKKASKEALDDGKTGYVPALGIESLREAVADFVSRTRHVRLTAANVAIQPGGKPVIEKFLLALMNEGDEVLYPTPGMCLARVSMFT